MEGVQPRAVGGVAGNAADGSREAMEVRPRDDVRVCSSGFAREHTSTRGVHRGAAFNPIHAQSPTQRQVSSKLTSQRDAKATALGEGGAACEHHAGVLKMGDGEAVAMWAERAV